MSERHGHLRAVQAYIVVHNSTDIRYRYPIVGTNRLLREYLPLLAYLGLRAQEGVGGWGEQIHALTGAALCVFRTEGRCCRCCRQNVQHVQLGSNTRGQGGCEVNVVRALPGYREHLLGVA